MPAALKIRPDQKIVYLRNWDDEKQRLTGVARLLQALGQNRPRRQGQNQCRIAASSSGTGQAPGGAKGVNPVAERLITGHPDRGIVHRATEQV